MLSHLIRPIVFLPFMAATLIWALNTPSTDTLLARCEATGASVTECKLKVLGR